MHTPIRKSTGTIATFVVGVVFFGLISYPAFSGVVEVFDECLSAEFTPLGPKMSRQTPPQTFLQKPPKKKEARFTVKGNCGQCEQRIMDALDQKGVIAAGWDRMKQEAWVVYKPAVVTEEQIHAYIAAAGHDTALKKADAEVYKRLPQCCLYRDGLNVHD